jgi:hypothetical protein
MADNIEEDFNTYDAFAKRMEERFPKMFSEPYGGFAIGKGWWPIVESLCANIQSHIDWNNQRAEKYPELCYKQVTQVTVAQIKEKFGGLRFYYNGGDERINGMVRVAESWADHTCEECGNKATRQTRGWIKNVCSLHFEERENARKERSVNNV